MALADVEAILIKATYTTNTREAAWVFSLCSFARHLWKILNLYFLHFILCVHLVRVHTIKMLYEFHTMYPWPPCGSLPSTACFCAWTCPHPVTFLLIGSGYFQAKPFPVYIPQHSQPQLFFIPTYLWRWNRQSVLECWVIKFRHQGNTQKKAYNIQNMAKFETKKNFKVLIICEIVNECSETWFLYLQIMYFSLLYALIVHGLSNTLRTVLH
jgi:hypothetical protein